MESPPRIQVARDGGATLLNLRDNLTGLTPRQATRVSLSRSTDCLNVLFDCEDAFPWATITRRDGPLYQEEVVELFLDPFGDLQCYFEIEVNPLGAIFDLILRRVGKGWRKEAAWKCESLAASVSTTAHGWRADLSIPFTSIAYEAPVPGTVWRANFLRIDRPPRAAPRVILMVSDSPGDFSRRPRFRRS